MAIKAVGGKPQTETHGIKFSYESGFLFIELPSGRRLAYVKPRIEENRFGGESITYDGVGTSKKWQRLETYSGKLVENIVQGIARDLLFYSLQTLSHCFIVGQRGCSCGRMGTNANFIKKIRSRLIFSIFLRTV